MFTGAPGVDIAPNGNTLVFAARVEQQTRSVAVVCDLPNCVSPKILPGGLTRLRWMPDGRTLVYIDPDARANLLTVPVAGGAPTQLTRFEDRQIVDFDVSPDGTQIVAARRLETNDIVVLKGLRRE